MLLIGIRDEVEAQLKAMKQMKAMKQKVQDLLSFVTVHR